MWKTLPVSSLNFFLLLRGAEEWFFFFWFFFPSSPSTSFLLWNVSNGQRLTSDWLNSKTISFVLIFLFENSYQFAQGKKWQSHLAHTHGRVSGWGARMLGAHWIFSRKEKDCKTSFGWKGSWLWPCHISGAACSIVWLALWSSSMELCLQRSGQERFLISKTSSFVAYVWLFFFPKSNQRHFCVTLANYLPFCIALLHSLSLHSNWVSPTSHLQRCL